MGPMNLAVYMVCIVYHHERWKVTDLDLYVHWKLVENRTTHFSNPKHTGGANDKAFDHHVNKYTSCENFGDTMMALQFKSYKGPWKVLNNMLINLS